MKTKIIYISGNELFEMADIRSAFEEVRTALSLGSDTVLFGVPVDSDDAFVEPEVAENTDTEIVVDNTTPITYVPEPTPAKPEKPKVVPITRAKHVEPEPEPEPIVEQIVDSVKGTEPAESPKSDDNVVPILSILGSETTVDAAGNNEPIDDNNETVAVGITETITTIDTNDDDIIDNDETESVTISDMIADEVPTQESEKTLEELLESMTPLGEDTKKSEPTTDTDIQENTSTDNETKSDTDTDLTLEKLATEFFENQDKIGTPEKTTSRGKIGKLKNILPFKKAKHDDSGLMGDLFGWAGVAANDEDFTIPGFFK